MLMRCVHGRPTLGPPALVTRVTIALVTQGTLALVTLRASALFTRGRRTVLSVAGRIFVRERPPTGGLSCRFLCLGGGGRAGLGGLEAPGGLATLSWRDVARHTSLSLGPHVHWRITHGAPGSIALSRPAPRRCGHSSASCSARAIGKRCGRGGCSAVGSVGAACRPVVSAGTTCCGARQTGWRSKHLGCSAEARRRCDPEVGATLAAAEAPGRPALVQGLAPRAMTAHGPGQGHLGMGRGRGGLRGRSREAG
jgi:hypothetical protein